VKVAENMFVAIDYRLTLDSGEEVDRSQEGRPLSFVAGSGMIIPGLESQLMGLEPGAKAKVTVEPEDGYGVVDEGLFRDIPKDRFPEGAELVPGAMFQASGPRGPIPMTVSKVDDAAGTVTVDMNHPLAGKRLHFDIGVAEVREPRPHELPQQSSCGCGPSEKDACGCGPTGCGSC
jgi:FKBP-type peptidyl-prolyl cis-trans isomerase SlyD